LVWRCARASRDAALNRSAAGRIPRGHSATNPYHKARFMLSVSLTQFLLVNDVFSFTIATMGAAAVFFFLQRSELAPRYRMVAVLAGIVPLVACYNYVRLFESWNGAYTESHGSVVATALSFNESYRYADWLITVPILVVNLVMVIDLPRRQAQVRCFVLGLLAFEMILLGYPGQFTSDATTRWLWWSASMVPFCIIVYQLYFTLGDAVRNQPESARHLVVLARFVLMLIWSAYPIIYVLPDLGVTGPNSFLFTQVGYACTDISAKTIVGMLFYLIAARKSAALLDAGQGETATRRAAMARA
jgi:bacteriorhodopsin